jgi:predicted LPLAT superfamily acyltransferase
MKDAGEKASHWSEYKEEAAGYWHLKLILILFHLLPVIVLRVIAFPVGFFYCLFSRRAREESRRYLEKMAAVLNPGTKSRKTVYHPLHHIIAFSLTLIEKVESWGGKVSLKRIHFQDDDITELLDELEKGNGALLISSHLGNMELLRALAGFNRTGVSREVPVTAIVDFTVTAYFNRMLQELNPASVMHIISAREIGPETVTLLQDRIAAGELVVIAGDRTSSATRDRFFMLPFLNEDAPFPYGPFFLTALVGAPAYFVFALRQKDVSLSSQYDMHIHKSPIGFDCKRNERNVRIEELARLFARYLEDYCKQHPYQWYNVYDFWAKPHPPEEHTDE